MKVKNREKNRREKERVDDPEYHQDRIRRLQARRQHGYDELQTPITQTRLISPEERRRTMRSINGMLNIGMTMPLSIPNQLN
jgi:hypothetical protein